MYRFGILYNAFHVAICTIMEAPTFNRIPSVSYELVHVAFALVQIHIKNGCDNYRKISEIP